MNSNFRRLGLSELLPRYSFSESLFARRSVLELNSVAATQGRSAQFLLTRGARAVVACDGDLAAVEAAQKALGAPNLRYRPCVFDDLRDGEFDLVLLADFAPYVRDPRTLEPVIRLLSREGYLVGGLRNPAGLAFCQLTEPEAAEAPPTFGQLLEVLLPHFPSVQLATQSPLVGYQLACEETEGFTVDGSLVEESDAAYFIAIAGRHPLPPLESLWVQLPAEPLAYTKERLEDFFQRSRSFEERSHQLEQTLKENENELSQREAVIERLGARLAQEKETTENLAARLSALETRGSAAGEGDRLATRVRELEVELDRAQDQPPRTHGRDFEVELQRAWSKVEEVEGERERFAARVRSLEVESDQERARYREEVGSFQAQIQGLSGQLEEVSRQMAQLAAKSNADALALEGLHADVRSAADRATEWEGRAMDLARRLREAETQYQHALAQWAEHSSRLEADFRSEFERMEAEAGILAEEKATLTALAQQLEGERSRLMEQVEHGATHSERELELARMISERDSRVQSMQQRIKSQEEELAALRNSLRRVAPNQVQQIYQRATAELSAVKAELFRRPGDSAAARSSSEEKEGTILPSPSGRGSG